MDLGFAHLGSTFPAGRDQQRGGTADTKHLAMPLPCILKLSYHIMGRQDPGSNASPSHEERLRVEKGFNGKA